MRKEYQWLLLIIIVASFLRFYDLPSLPPGLYPDEAMNGNNALEALSAVPPTHGFKIFYPENNGREGLFINIQALFLSAFGNKPWVLRLPSAIFGILTVLGIYFLTKELFKENKILPLLAAFLLATSFWHINFSRIGFRAIMAPFFLIWGIYFLLKALRLAKEKMSPKYYILNSIFSGIFYGLGFYSYIAYRATPALILIILAVFLKRAKRGNWLKRFYIACLVFLLFSFIIALPLGVYFLNHPEDFLGRTSQISIFSSATPVKDLLINTAKTAGMFNFMGDWNWRHNIAGKPLLFWPVGIMLIIGVVTESARLIKNLRLKTDNSNLGFLVLLSWILITALPVVISNEGMPHALRAILMAPPVIILAAVGGFWIYNFLKQKINNRLLTSATLVLLGFLVIEAYTSYFIVWGRNPNTADAFSQNYVKIAEEINQLPKETPKFVIVNPDGVDVRGLPMPAQTVMFLTDTFQEKDRKDKNLQYLLPEQLPNTVIPEGSRLIYLN